MVQRQQPARPDLNPLNNLFPPRPIDQQADAALGLAVMLDPTMQLYHTCFMLADHSVKLFAPPLVDNRSPAVQRHVGSIPDGLLYVAAVAIHEVFSRPGVGNRPRLLPLHEPGTVYVDWRQVHIRRVQPQ